jgi:hypothetical protein
VKDAGAVPVVHRTLKRFKKNKKSKKKADVCDGDGDMPQGVANTLMLVMKMTSMDEMDDTVAMNVLAPAIKAMRSAMEDIGEQGTETITDLAIVESMLSPPAAPVTRKLHEELETTSRSGERKLLHTASQQASWNMAYYSFSIILMNAGYAPGGPLTNDITNRGSYFDFAAAVADYVSSNGSGVSWSYYSLSRGIAERVEDYPTVAFKHFESIFNLLGIGKQLELARAWTPLAQ